MSTIWKPASLVVLVLATLVAAADDGDDFSNNLFSDLAPLLALFGERATMQFMSQSMGWADNIILAMAPLGIITALVSAIRVGGPQWLKAIVGRARENLAAAEVELMSSTSKEVCELWNGQQVVRSMGESPIKEFICLLQHVEGSKNTENEEDHLTEIDSGFQAKLQQWRGKKNARNDLEKDPGQAQPESSSPPNQLSYRIVLLRNKSDDGPNISLNSHRQSSRRELYMVALFGTVLQLGVMVFSGVITYHLKLPKNGAPIARYAFPCNLLGTVFLVTGMLFCGYVVESSTEEKSYKANRDETQTKIYWLQQPKTVNDQVFESFAIWARDRRTITKSKRIGDGSVSKSGSEGSQEDHCGSVFKSFSIQFQGDAAAVDIRSSEGQQPRTDCPKNTEQTSTNRRFQRFTKYMTKTVFSTVFTLCGFILQFIGLRGLHWSSSVFQLGAVLIMTSLRAWVRRGLVEKLGSKPLDSKFELEWFALSLRKPKDLFSLPTNSQDNPSGRLQENVSNDSGEKDFKDWRVVAENSMDRYEGLREVKEYEIPQIQMKDGMLDAYGVMETRRQLGVLADWQGPAAVAAISLAKAIETTMDALFASHSCSKFVWSLKVCHGRGTQKIYIEIERPAQGAKWKVDSSQIDAALSLWLYCTNDKDKQMPPKLQLKPKDLAIRQRGNGDSHLRGNEPSAKLNLQLLGPCTNSLYQDLAWWLPADGARVRRVIETDQDTSGVVIVEPHRVVGCGMKQEVTPQVRKGPRLFKGLKYDEATCDSQVSLLAIESIVPLELLYSQEMFSAFMWAAAKTLNCPIEGDAIIQPISIESGQDDWKSFTLRNEKLHKLVQDICDTGLGNLVQIYLAIIPSLSAEKKLPKLDKIVDLAREKAKPHEQAGHWELVADIYQWLLKVVTKSSQDHYAAQRATTIVMEYLARVNRNIELRKNQQYRDKDLQSLRTVQSRIEESLNAIDQTVKETIQACKGQGRRSALEILERGAIIPTAGIEKKDIYDWTVLHYAMTQKLDSRLFRRFEQLLDGFKADIDIQDHQGRTPLHYACIEGKEQVAKDLLRRGAKGDVLCMDGRSPFYYSVMNCDVSTVRTFVEAGTLIDSRDSLGQTPLFLAAFKGKGEVVQYLWQDANQRLRDNQGRVVLHMASMGGGIDVVKWLIEDGKVDKEARDGSGRTSLHLAADAGNQTVVRYLIDDAKVNKEAKDDGGNTPLHVAADAGHKTVVRYLIDDAKVNKEAKDDGGNTPLHVAADAGHEAVVRYLIDDTKVDKDAKDGSGRTPLHLAAGLGRQAVVRYLIDDAKVNKEAKDDGGNTPLHVAADAGHKTVVRYLIDNAKVNKEAKDDGGNTPLHVAADAGHEAVVRYLIDDTKVDKDAKDGSGRTPLHLAAGLGRQAVMRYLIDDAKVNKEAKDDGGNTPLHVAADAGHEAVVRYLIDDTKVDKDAKDGSGRTSLHLAAGSGHEAVVRYLIEDAKVDKEAKDDGGNTPLHVAADAGHEAVVRYLIDDARVLKEARDGSGRTSLHLAAGSGHEAVVRYLIEDAKVDKEAKDGSGRTSLHLAADAGNQTVVQYLIEDAKVDQNSQDQLNETALHKAVRAGHKTIVDYLLDQAMVDKSIRNIFDQLALEVVK